MKVYDTLTLMGLKELPHQINFQVIEISPDEIRYGNLREGVYKISWYRE